MKRFLISRISTKKPNIKTISVFICYRHVIRQNLNLKYCNHLLHHTLHLENIHKTKKQLSNVNNIFFHKLIGLGYKF